jgi:hypothetical protein
VGEWFVQVPRGCDESESFVFQAQVAGQRFGLNLAENYGDKVRLAVEGAGDCDFVDVIKHRV